MSESDVPEPDAIEQSQVVADPDIPSQPSLEFEAPEADALEQSQPAPIDEDDAPR